MKNSDPARPRAQTAAKVPKGLSVAAKKIWVALTREYGVDDAAGLEILGVGLEAFDRMRGAQRRVKQDGQTYRDRFGQLKMHPLLSVERDARAQYLAALKQLNLDLEPLRDRPGRPGGK